MCEYCNGRYDQSEPDQWPPFNPMKESREIISDTFAKMRTDIMQISEKWYSLRAALGNMKTSDPAYLITEMMLDQLQFLKNQMLIQEDNIHKNIDHINKMLGG